MKLAILGAAGVRTPLVLQSIIAGSQQVGLSELSLMDVDSQRLDLIRATCEALIYKEDAHFKIEWTLDARRALHGADFVITTFRVGGMESRVIDEQVPLNYGVLGQETTGPGGFAMALRTIPVVLDYVQLIREEAPGAWILNFTNPAGIITEAIINVAGYRRAIGICDNPPSMWRAAAALFSQEPAEFLVEYFGLNHLGWISAIHHQGQDRLNELIEVIESANDTPLPGLPLEPGYIRMLGMIPNEYNYFYTNTRQVLENMKQAGQSRAQQIMPFNMELYENLDQLKKDGAPAEGFKAAYLEYLAKRGETYMSIETGHKHTFPTEGQEVRNRIETSAQGYSEVALEVIKALVQPPASLSILNIPNQGAIQGMEADDVVEVTSYIGQGTVRPLAIGRIPDHALGLMKQVKEYEKLTIRAAVERSYPLALKALAQHPLVPSLQIARSILDDYCKQHGAYFPVLR